MKIDDIFIFNLVENYVGSLVRPTLQIESISLHSFFLIAKSEW